MVPKLIMRLELVAIVMQVKDKLFEKDIAGIKKNLEVLDKFNVKFRLTQGTEVASHFGLVVAYSNSILFFKVLQFSKKAQLSQAIATGRALQNGEPGVHWLHEVLLPPNDSEHFGP